MSILSFIANDPLIKVVIASLLSIATFLGGVVSFFLWRIYLKFVDLVDDVNQIKKDLAIVQFAYAIDHEKTNGGTVPVKRRSGKHP